MSDPTIMFLILHVIKHDSGWAIPTEITPIIACLFFSIFSVFVMVPCQRRWPRGGVQEVQKLQC